MSEVLDLAVELINTPSPSRSEAAACDLIEQRLSGAGHLELHRIGDNLIARTILGHRRRLVIAGHLDTVSSSEPAAMLEGGILAGLGAADMKGTLAAMAVLAAEVTDPVNDVTWVFYAREEIGRSESGLLEIATAQPELLEGDVAILGEPTSGAVEAGCQGTLRLVIRLGGVKAHTARPFMGVNAIHRSAAVMADLIAATPRRVELDGVTFVEQLQVVSVEGGVGHNVVPDQVTVVVNHRFAPDRDVAAALEWVTSLIEGHLDPDIGDSIELADGADGAAPALGDPVLARLVEITGGQVSAKVGWTDVATFAALGVPAANFGAGDPLLAHHPDEHVAVEQLDSVADALRSLLGDASLA